MTSRPRSARGFRRGPGAAPNDPRTVAEAEQLIKSHRLNVLVARAMELVNRTRKAIDSGCSPADRGGP